jgi:hypothetical protein
MNLKFYSAIAAGLFAGKKECEAQISYTDILPDMIVGTCGDWSYLDLNNDGIFDLQLSTSYFYDDDGTEFSQSAIAQVMGLNGLEIAGDDNPFKLIFGEPIDNDLPWLTGMGILATTSFWYTCYSSACENGSWGSGEDGFWLEESDGFLGFRMMQDADTIYGWLRLSVDLFNYIEVKDFAYEQTPGETIKAGAFNCEDFLADFQNTTVNTCGLPCIDISVTDSYSSEYQWMFNGAAVAGATNFNYQACAEGNYAVSWILADLNCQDTSNTVFIHQTSAATQPIISKLNDSLFADFAASWQWMENDTIVQGAIDQYFFPDHNGTSFQVAIVDSNGCTATSEYFVFGNCAFIPHELLASQDSSFICYGDEYELEVPDSSLFSYQWYNGNAVIPGAIYPAYLADSDGIFYSGVSGFQTTCYSDSFKLIVSDKPVITLIGDTLFSTPGVTYQWKIGNGGISGATDQSYVPIENSTQYLVKTTDTAGCLNFSDYFNFFICEFTNYPQFPVENQVACEPDAVEFWFMFDMEVWYPSCQWFRNDSLIFGATSNLYTATQPGNYYCRYHLVNPVDSFCNSDPIVVVYLDVPTISFSDDTLVSSSVEFNQWLLNGIPIPGETSQKYVPLATGNYSVRVTGTNGCTLTSDSVSVAVSLTENPGLPDSGVTIWNDGKMIQIQFSNDDYIGGNLTVINTLGSVVRKMEVNQLILQIPFTENESGWFLFRIENKERSFITTSIIF